MELNQTILILVIVHLIAFVFGYGILIQKVRTINGEVQNARKWRHWAHDKIKELLIHAGLSSEGP